MQEGGHLKVTAKNTIIERDLKTLRPGKYVNISIIDQGEGISENRLEEIFEPYYTTKEFGVQKGTGLGLSISKSIMQKHGGDITVKSCIQRLSATLGFKDFGWSFKFKALFKTVVKPVFDLCQLLYRDISQVDFFRYKASYQPDCVLYGFLLVTAVGFTKI